MPKSISGIDSQALMREATGGCREWGIDSIPPEFGHRLTIAQIPAYAV